MDSVRAVRKEVGQTGERNLEIAVVYSRCLFILFLFEWFLRELERLERFLDNDV